MSVFETISPILDDLMRQKLKSMSKNLYGCSDTMKAYSAECRNDFRQGNPLTTLAAQVATGDTKMIKHTIYNRKSKTTEQIGDILLLEQDRFLAANPGYQYDNYRVQDGKYGERVVILIFKRKAGA